jgi:hypothetical protein
MNGVQTAFCCVLGQTLEEKAKIKNLGAISSLKLDTDVISSL